MNDPHVIAIKMTLYRIGTNSPLVDLLVEAAEEGKQVAVLVELKARFDERNNIKWANRLEAAGAHVAYGLVNLKTHGKLCLVVSKEADGIRRYAHIGTGNYNAGTARAYTDVGLFTARSVIVEDVSDIFNFLTGYSNRREYRELLVAPVSLRSGLSALIEAETSRSARGTPGRDRDEDQRADRSRDDSRALPRVASRRDDRSHHSRRLQSAARRSRRERTHHRAIDRRPLSRTLADFLVPRRRHAARVHRERRPDGAQSRSTRRSAVSRSATRGWPTT